MNDQNHNDPKTSVAARMTAREDDVLCSVAHTLIAEGAIARIYRYDGRDTEPGDRSDSIAHLVVFARNIEELKDIDPQVHGFSPIELQGLIELINAVSALTDYYEERCSMFETAERLKDLDVFDEE